ncbi:MAG TPA: ATP-binding protein [Thermoleophilaceae bacterium]|nr:ATP-binding protein [Thermoleophilaceae bacterium]
MSPARSVLQFALAALLAVVLLGVLATLVVRSETRREAIRDAKAVTRLAGRGIAQPALSAGIYSGDPAALRRIHRAMQAQVLREPVVRVKIWSADGRILWSDEPRLIGRRFALGAEEREALRGGRTNAEVSDLTRPENWFERHYEKLLEVYLPIRGPDGRPLLFEAYSRFSSITESGRRRMESLALPLVGALFLLWLATLPLAWSLARRLQQRQREREALLQRAIDAQDRERRRIASALHDDVVQDVAGLGFWLSAAAAKSDSPELHEAATQARQTMRKLRSTLVDIYPPSIQRAGLQAAIDDLTDSLDASVEIHAPATTGLPPEKDALLFRTVQEGLRNVAKHADAEHVIVRVEVRNGLATAEVADDGRGFTPNGSRDPEHMGLELLSDLAEEAGGRLAVESRPGAGTKLRLEVPAA